MKRAASINTTSEDRNRAAPWGTKTVPTPWRVKETTVNFMIYTYSDMAHTLD